MNAQQVKEIGAQRFVITTGQIVAIIMSIVVTGGGSLAYISAQWATVNLRLDQTEASVKTATEAAEAVRERLSSIESDSRNDRRILLRLEDKLDDMRSGATRYGSVRPPG